MSNPQSFDQNQFPAVEQPRKKKKKWPWIVGIGAVLVIVAAMNGGDSDDAGTDAAGIAQQAEAEPEAVVGREVEPTQEAPTDLQLGETADVGGMQATVTTARFATDFFGDTYICIDVALTNGSDRQKSFSPYDFELVKPNGVVANPAIHGLDVKTLEYADLNPGGTTDGAVCFDGAESGSYQAIYQGGLFDKPVSWALAL